MKINKKYIDQVVIIVFVFLVLSCINNKRKEKENIVEGLDGNTKDKGGFMGTGYSTTTLMFIGLIPVVLFLIIIIFALKIIFNIFFGSSDSGDD